jgi:hypothetical protein
LATSAFEPPSAQANTIRDRIANTCDDFTRRDQRVNVSRSAALSTNSALGRPVLAIEPVYRIIRRISDAGH